MEFEAKLDLLGSGASEEVACQSCAVNPQAAVVTHRANQPIAAKDIQPRPRDLKPWLSSATRSAGKKLHLSKQWWYHHFMRLEQNMSSSFS